MEFLGSAADGRKSKQMCSMAYMIFQYIYVEIRGRFVLFCFASQMINQRSHVETEDSVGARRLTVISAGKVKK
jgi:hypothetical protein